MSTELALAPVPCFDEGGEGGGMDVGRGGGEGEGGGGGLGDGGGGLGGGSGGGGLGDGGGGLGGGGGGLGDGAGGLGGGNGGGEGEGGLGGDGGGEGGGGLGDGDGGLGDGEGGSGGGDGDGGEAGGGILQQASLQFADSDCLFFFAVHNLLHFFWSDRLHHFVTFFLSFFLHVFLSLSAVHSFGDGAVVVRRLRRGRRSSMASSGAAWRFSMAASSADHSSVGGGGEGDGDANGDGSSRRGWLGSGTRVLAARSAGSHCGGYSTGWSASGSLLATLDLAMCERMAVRKTAATPMRTSARRLEASDFAYTNRLRWGD